MVHTEMPFFWKLDTERCLEGIIDLAFFDREARRWLILDWKTNRVTLNEIDMLRAQYLSQLAAYWAAIRGMTDMKVEAAIYSTPVAAVLRYEEKELAREWSRLRTLSPDRFAAEVVPDERNEIGELSEQLEFGEW